MVTPTREKNNDGMEGHQFVIEEFQHIFGDSGTQRYSGFISEEPNSKWRDQQRITIVEQMRRTDGALKGLLNALKSPILATQWDVVGGEPEVNQFIREQLFDMEKRTWRNFMREALGYFDFGFYVFEINWEVQNGKVVLADLAPRIPRSIHAWEMRDGGEGIQQLIRTDKVEETIVDIPKEKLLVLTNDMEGDDITGQSILRPGYKHFVIKDGLYRVQSVSAERYGVGIPYAYMPDTLGNADKTKMEDLLKNVRSNEANYLLIPWKKEEGEVGIMTPQGDPKAGAIENAIDHHNKMILLSVLAGFLGLGTDSTGSFALSKDQSSFFLKHVEDKAQYIADEITRQVIKKMVYYNFGEDVECPKLEFSPLGDIDFAEYSQVIERLVNMGVIQNDLKTEVFVRDTFHLPSLSEDEMEQREEQEIQDQLAELEGETGEDEFGFAEDGFDEEPDDEEIDEEE